MAKTHPRQKSESDSRYFPRWEVENKVVYKHENGVNFHECITHDISNTGMCLRTYERINPNEKIAMTIHLTDGLSVQVEGRALWEKRAAKDFLVGVHFENIPEKVQDAIFNCAFECQPKDFQSKWFEGF